MFRQGGRAFIQLGAILVGLLIRFAQHGNGEKLFIERDQFIRLVAGERVESGIEVVSFLAQALLNVGEHLVIRLEFEALVICALDFIESAEDLAHIRLLGIGEGNASLKQVIPSHGLDDFSRAQPGFLDGRDRFFGGILLVLSGRLE